ncbi:MAG: threonine synthase, partial [Opitutales bacterium]|nr:threonine synthase [Opitutales bacterium]
KKWSLAAVNSINLARILAQCVYYIYASLKLPKELRGDVEFIVPTGNFGNILAGWMAHKMGMPARSFKVATNQNDILYRLFESGVYEIGSVRPSHAPSMDIQVSSNFERFIYFMEGGDSEKVRKIMGGFKASGKWVFDDFKKDNFSASRCSDADIEKNIELVYQKYGKIIDPHTACGFQQIGSGTTVVLSTAHPAKFPELIKKVVSKDALSPSLEILKSRKIERIESPCDVENIRKIIEENGIKQ